MPKLTQEQKTEKMVKHLAEQEQKRLDKLQKEQEKEEKRLEWVAFQEQKRADKIKKKTDKKYYCKCCKIQFTGLNFDKDKHLGTTQHILNKEKLLSELTEAKALIEYCKDMENWDI